jgi:WD40 repeat protein
VWDLRTGTRALHLSLPPTAPPALSSDGALLAVAVGGRAILWDVAASSQRHELSVEPDQVAALAFSPDGRVLACATRQQSIKLWDADTGQVLAALSSPAARIGAVAFSPDGKSLAAAIDGTVALWGPGPASPGVPPSVAPTQPAVTVAAAKVPATPAPATPAAAGTLLQLLQPASDPTRTIAFDRASHFLVSIGRQGTLRRWDADTGAKEPQETRLGTASNGTMLSRDGRTAAALQFNGVDLWDGDKRSVIQKLRVQTTAWKAALSPDGIYFATEIPAAVPSAPGDLTIYSVAAGVRQATLDDVWFPSSMMASIVSAVAFSPDSSLFAAGDCLGQVRIWRVPAGGGQTMLQAANGPIGAIAISHRADTLAALCGDGVFVADIATGQRRHALPLGFDAAGSSWLAFSPDDARVITPGANQTIQIWDAKTGFRLAQLGGHARTINDVALSSDGELFASADDVSIRVWSMKGAFAAAPVVVTGPPSSADPNLLPYDLFTIHDRVVGIMNEDPARTIADHGRPATPDQLRGLRSRGGGMVGGAAYQVFRIPNRGATQVSWTGSAGGTQVYLSYWNGQKYVIKDLRNVKKVASHAIDIGPFTPGPWLYVQVNCPTSHLSTNGLSATLTPSSASPAPPSSIRATTR